MSEHTNGLMDRLVDEDLCSCTCNFLQRTISTLILRNGYVRYLGVCPDRERQSIITRGSERSRKVKSGSLVSRKAYLALDPV